MIHFSTFQKLKKSFTKYTYIDREKGLVKINLFECLDFV